MFGQYSKTIAAVVTAVIGWITMVVESASDSITSGEWIAGITMLAMALGVFTVPNKPASPCSADALMHRRRPWKKPLGPKRYAALKKLRLVASPGQGSTK